MGSREGKGYSLQNPIRSTGPRLVELNSNQPWSVRARSPSPHGSPANALLVREKDHSHSVPHFKQETTWGGGEVLSGDMGFEPDRTSSPTPGNQFVQKKRGLNGSCFGEWDGRALHSTGQRLDARARKVRLQTNKRDRRPPRSPGLSVGANSGIVVNICDGVGIRSALTTWAEGETR
jgi:hypothetical protein